MSVEISGLDDLEDSISELVERVESFGGELPMDELFAEDFMQAYTEFDTFERFLEESWWSVESQEDFERLPADEFDRYIDEHTGFNDWETMLRAAGREYIMRLRQNH